MPTSQYPSTPSPSRQHGAVLVTGLLIMMVMTLIGITTMQSSITQSNLASNAQLSAVGFQSTEAALARAANDAALLGQALDNGIDVGTDSLEYSQFQAILDIQINDDYSVDRTATPVNTDIEVTSLGQMGICSRAKGINSDESINGGSQVTCAVFQLAAVTTIGANAQASTQHTQLSDRLIPSPPGGMPTYRSPNQANSNN